MKPKLKLNHITDLHDARYCAAVGIDLLGFQLEAAEADAIAPKSVAEIMDWLSGPVGVGEFDTASPAEIQEILAVAKLDWVSLPLDYPQGQAQEVAARLIFRGPAAAINADGLAHLQGLAAAFPEALLEFEADPEDAAIWEALKASGLLARAILRFAEPSAIYSLLEKEGHAPHAFSLGDFVEEPDGAIDYESCDDFLERFSELVPA